MERVAFDTGFVIEIERGRISADALRGEGEAALPAICAAELLRGADSGDPRQRTARKAHVERVLAAMPILPYDLAVARIHAGLLLQVTKSGRHPGAHDLIIAATAIATRRRLLTTDRSFERIPGLRATIVPVGRGH